MIETEDRTYNKARDVSLIADDGFVLAGRLYEPPSKARATLLVNAATGAPQTYYATFADHAAARGFRVLTYDYRGVGRSRPDSLQGFGATMTDWALRDARAALRFVETETENAPLVVIGHSFGAQLVGLVDEMRRADAAVFVGGQLGYYGHWPMLQRIGLGALWSLLPAVTRSVGYAPAFLGLGVDLPAGVATEWARWCSHPQYLMRDYADARDRFARFDVPTLLYEMTDDFYAPRGAVDAFAALLPQERLVRREVRPEDFGGRPVGHFGLFRRRFRATLWGEVLGFVNDALSGELPAVTRRARRSTPATTVTMDDIVADLQYGRA